MNGPELAPGGDGKLPHGAALLDAETRKQVLTKGRAIALSQAKKLACGDEGKFDELISIGMVACVERAPEFDKSLGASFTTYIFPYVRGAMLDFLDREKTERSIRRAMVGEVRRFGACHEESYDALADSTEKTFAEVSVYAHRVAAATFMVAAEAAMRRGTEEDRLAFASSTRAVKAVRSALGAMSAVEQRIYELYFCGEEKLTLPMIAQELGVSAITVRRRLDAMLDKLHATLLELEIDRMPPIYR